METTSSQSQAELVQGTVMKERVHDASSYINELIAAAGTLNTYSCDYKMVCHKKKPPEIETGKMYFKKPHLIRGEIKSGPKRGSLAVLCRDGKVHGHMGGVMAWFNGSLAPYSDMLRCINGFPMVDTDFFSLAHYLKEKMLDKGDKSLVSDQPIKTANTPNPTYVLDMFSGSGDQALLKKRVFLDPKSNIPVYWEDYTDGKLYAQSYWTNLQTNIDLPDNLFTPP